MLKKTITFEDLDGNTVTEDFYFHLSKADLVELEVTADGNSMELMVQRIAKANDGRGIIDTFKKIILMSVGERSEDGRRFIKTQEIRDAFEQSEAYSELFLELATNAQAGIDFISGVVPKSLGGKLDGKLPELIANAEAAVE
jgi:hypothetical protein